MDLPDDFKKKLLEADLVSPSFLWYAREMLDQCKKAPHGVYYMLQHDFTRYADQYKLSKRLATKNEVFEGWMNSRGLKHSPEYLAEYMGEKAGEFLTRSTPFTIRYNA